MTISGIDHYNIVTSDLETTRRFYADILGLTDGARPPFSRPGAWMYLGEQAILHIGTGRAPETKKSDAFDHIAFRASGLDAMREKLRARGIYFEEFGVPERNLHQVFFRDPNGTEIELVYSGVEASAAAAAGAKVDASKGRNT